MRPLLFTTVVSTVLSLVACGGSTSSDTGDAGDATAADTNGGSDTNGGVDTNGVDGSGSDTKGSDTGGRVPLNHRADDSACGGAPAPGSCGLGGGGGPGACAKDTDCTTGTNGRCVENVGGGARVCFCSYDTCTHDSDCATGKLCVCHGSPYTAGGNTCSDGGCRTDSDCGAGGYCSPTRGGGCGGLSGYFCHTSSDTCIDDGDCPADGGGPRICAYSSSSKHWECTAQLLCP